MAFAGKDTAQQNQRFEVARPAWRGIDDTVPEPVVNALFVHLRYLAHDGSGRVTGCCGVADRNV